MLQRVTQWTGAEMISVISIVEFLNELIQLDSDLVEHLINTRYPCKAEILQGVTLTDETRRAGFLSMLNSFFGMDASKQGPIGVICTHKVVCFTINKTTPAENPLFLITRDR